MINKCCENCIYYDEDDEDSKCQFSYEYDYSDTCKEQDFDGFIAEEEIVRQDERENIRHQILNSNFYIEDDNGKTYDVLVNELKPKMIDTFEESIRQDEKNKILDLLKEDLEDYKKLREEYKDNKGLTIENTALIVYINNLIYTIKN